MEYLILLDILSNNPYNILVKYAKYSDIPI